MRRILSAAMAVAVSLTVVPLHVKAGDWPQILGPNRNGTAVDERIPPNYVLLS